MADSSSTTGGIGFTGLLLLTFIVLKLTDVIAWSWWWVLSPAWIGAAIVVVVLILAVILALIGAITSR